MKKTTKYASPIAVGSKVFIRTVTHHYTGKIVALTKEEMVLSHAAWIADNGRFSQALASGQFNEVEPYPDVAVSISRGAVLDVSEWQHDLPLAVK